MKIWKEFGSSHSGNVSVIGTFENLKDAQEALKIVEDFVLGDWEDRYPTFEEFLEKWTKDFHPNLKHFGFYENEYRLGVDNTPEIEIQNNTIMVSELRSQNYNVGGIIKLLFFAGAKKTEVLDNRR